LLPAVGKSKKLAKRNAALAMLNAVRQGFVEPLMPLAENDEYGEDDTIHMVSIILYTYVTAAKHYFPVFAVMYNFLSVISFTYLVELSRSTSDVKLSSFVHSGIMAEIFNVNSAFFNSVTSHIINEIGSL
jgi:hypothetical protein